MNCYECDGIGCGSCEWFIAMQNCGIDPLGVVAALRSDPTETLQSVLSGESTEDDFS